MAGVSTLIIVLAEVASVVGVSWAVAASWVAAVAEVSMVFELIPTF